MSGQGLACIKRGYLYNDAGGTEYLTYAQWVNDHVQDSEVAFSRAQEMLSSRAGHWDNIVPDDGVFEVYTITNREVFVCQMNAYNDEDQEVSG